MSHYPSLVGQCFSRHGATFTIVRCEGATVLASMRRRGGTKRVLLPMDAVLEALEVPEITMTELPRPRHDVSHA